MDIIREDRFEQILSSLKGISPLLVVGDVGIDKYTFGEVERISPEAPVPILRVIKEWRKLGMAANISHNLQSLEIPSTLCCLVGNDLKAKELETLLEDINLKTWGVIRDRDRSTTFKERITTKTQQICRIDYETQRFPGDEVAHKLLKRVEEFLPNHSSLIIEDYSKGSLSEAMIQRLITIAKEHNCLVAVDPGREKPASFYRGASLLKPNLSEGRDLVASLGYNEKNFEKICEILVSELNLKMLALTLGGEGMALVDRSVSDEVKLIPTVANEVYDVSGAGDTVIAMLVSSLMTGADLEESAWLANCAAGVVVSKKGTATVTMDELKSFYQNILAGVQ